MRIATSAGDRSVAAPSRGLSLHPVPPRGSASSRAGHPVSGRLFTLSLAVAIPALSGGAARSAPASGRRPPSTRSCGDLDRPARAVRLGLTAAEDEPHVTLGLRRIRLGSGPRLGRRPAGSARRPRLRGWRTPRGGAARRRALRWRVGRAERPPRDGPSFLAEPTDALARAAAGGRGGPLRHRLRGPRPQRAEPHGARRQLDALPARATTSSGRAATPT
jgi:hypothetical protein